MSRRQICSLIWLTREGFDKREIDAIPKKFCTCHVRTGMHALNSAFFRIAELRNEKATGKEEEETSLRDLAFVLCRYQFTEWCPIVSKIRVRLED